MAIAKVYSNQDIVNGSWAVNEGNKCVTGENTALRAVQHIPSGDSLALFQNLNNRFRNKGGPLGSGQWEFV
jgi:hypothetical protein